jgi:hypothetical protein
MRRREPAPGGEDVWKCGAVKPFSAWEHEKSDRQSAAAGAAAFFYNVAARGCGAPGAEPVRPRALPLFRLIGSFCHVIK